MERSFWQIVKKFFEPWGYMRGVFLRSMMFPIVAAGITVVIVECMRQVVDGVETGNIALAEDYLRYFMGIVVVRLVLRWFMKNWGHPEIRPTGGRKLSQKYLSEYVLLDNNKMEMRGTGRLITIFEKGIWTWTEMLALVFTDITRLLAKTVFLLVYVFMLDWVYGIGFLLLISLVIINYIYTQEKANIYRRIRRDYYIEYMRSFVKVIMSKFEMLQTGGITRELDKYNTSFPQWYDLNKSIETYRYVSEGFSVIVIDGLRVFAIVSVLRGTALGKVTIGEFVALTSVLVLLDEITREISRKYIDMTAKYVYIEKLWDIIDETPKITGYIEGEDFQYKAGDIKLEHITYAYDEINIFDTFSLDIEGGKKTALVGISGAGKSTLVKLISGYLRADGGKVRIDGQDLDDISLKSYYKHIGYLTQDPMVFDGTVRENLTYALHVDHVFAEGEDIEQRMEDALAAAKCEFVYDFPAGLQTEIGERGIRLSGGQRQRLAIAKIFLKNPEIIILDEPTAALDSFSEEAITEAMHNLFEGRTVIIIAHRLQTVKAADDIILIEEGKVIERGTHDDLVTQGGQYASMLELQSGF